jgi:hypothetical protein
VPPRSNAVSETETLEQFFYNNQQSLSEEEEKGSEEKTESEGNKNKEHNSQVKEELMERLEGLYLREETEPKEETESDKTENKLSANQGTRQAAGTQVLVPTNGQEAKSLVPDPRFFNGD